MNHNIYIYILVMAAVTYLIRMLPLALSRKEITSPFIKSFLYYVPYACLAAMTFPAILFATDSVISAAFWVFGKMFSMLFAVMIAFSAVSRKERLARQCKALLYAAVPEKGTDWLLGMGMKISGIFAGFIIGPALEAFILGSMVFVGMLILRFPNAFAISALVMRLVCAPIIGAWASAMVGAVMILASDSLGFVLVTMYPAD